MGPYLPDGVGNGEGDGLRYGGEDGVGCACGASMRRGFSGRTVFGCASGVWLVEADFEGYDFRAVDGVFGGGEAVNPQPMAATGSAIAAVTISRMESMTRSGSSR